MDKITVTQLIEALIKTEGEGFGDYNVSIQYHTEDGYIDMSLHSVFHDIDRDFKEIVFVIREDEGEDY